MRAARSCGQIKGLPHPCPSPGGRGVLTDFTNRRSAVHPSPSGRRAGDEGRDLKQIIVNTVACNSAFAAFTFVSILTCATSAAQPYPTRPIRLIVSFAAGGTADVIARSVGNEAGAQLGQPLVLDNRGGAKGIIGIDIVAKAPPDGHTLLHSELLPAVTSPTAAARRRVDNLCACNRSATRRCCA